MFKICVHVKRDRMGGGGKNKFYWDGVREEAATRREQTARRCVDLMSEKWRERRERGLLNLVISAAGIEWEEQCMVCVCVCEKWDLILASDYRMLQRGPLGAAAKEGVSQWGGAKFASSFSLIAIYGPALCRYVLYKSAGDDCDSEGSAVSCTIDLSTV